MAQSIETQIGDFFDGLPAGEPFLAFAAHMEAQGQARLAHLLRAAARSEQVRCQVMRDHLVSASVESDLFTVCPRCGLIFAGEPDEPCPVDRTPGDRFERVA